MTVHYTGNLSQGNMSLLPYSQSQNFQEKGKSQRRISQNKEKLRRQVQWNRDYCLPIGTKIRLKKMTQIPLDYWKMIKLLPDWKTRLLLFYEEQKETLLAFKELVGTPIALHPDKRAIDFKTKQKLGGTKATWFRITHQSTSSDVLFQGRLEGLSCH